MRLEIPIFPSDIDAGIKGSENDPISLATRRILVGKGVVVSSVRVTKMGIWLYGSWGRVEAPLASKQDVINLGEFTRRFDRLGKRAVQPIVVAAEFPEAIFTHATST